MAEEVVDGADVDAAKPAVGRGGRIRTDDIQLPKLALYQAELRPVIAGMEN